MAPSGRGRGRIRGICGIRRGSRGRPGRNETKECSSKHDVEKTCSIEDDDSLLVNDEVGILPKMMTIVRKIMVSTKMLHMEKFQ